MSKKRKTKRQKMEAVHRHEFATITRPTNVSPHAEIRINTTNAPVNKVPPPTEAYSYAHVAYDVRQTLMVTAILLAANIAFYFLLKIRLVNLFGIVF